MAKTMDLIVDAATATKALANPVPATAVPGSGYKALDAGTKSVRINLAGYHDTTPDNNDFAYQVVLWRQAKDQDDAGSQSTLAVPELVAKGVATLGQMVVGDADGDGDYLYADTITNTHESRPDVMVYSPADDTQGFIYLEPDDAVGIEVEVDCDGGSGTAVSSAYAWIKEGTEAHPFFLRSLLTDGPGSTGAATKELAHTSVITTSAADLFTVSGNVLITNVIVSVGADAMEASGGAATMIVATDSATYASGSRMSIAKGDLTAGSTHDLATETSAAFACVDGDKIQVQAAVNDFTSDPGTTKYIVEYVRMSQGAGIAAA